MTRSFGLLLPLVMVLAVSACSPQGDETMAEGEMMSETEIASCEVVPGTAVQVSNEQVQLGERSMYMFELQLALNPKDASQLVASGIYHRAPTKGDADQMQQRVYAWYSADSGKTWQKATLPPFPPVDGKEPFGGDPTVVFSRNGAALYMTYTTPNSAHLSTDGGRTWSQPVKMTDDGLDHWMVAGDYTNGPYGGSVYAWGMGTKDLKKRDPKATTVDYNFIEYQMRLLTSKDDGKTWTDKLATTTTELGIKGNGLNSVSDILVARNGRLYLPFHSWNNVDRNGPYGQWMMVSDDGGQTFSKPHQLKKADGSLLMGPRGGSMPAYALDATNGPYKNRLYTAWMDSTSATSGRWQLLYSHSDDGGETFTEPKVILDSLLRMDIMHPDMRVNNRGVLALAYYHYIPEGPDSTDKKGVKRTKIAYNRYVTASLDGGKTFLTPQPLAPMTSRIGGGLYEWGWSVSGVDIGDYFNVVSGPDGKFHTTWQAGANGPTQIWYAPFGVKCGNRTASAVAPRP
jgi:hypothetical protein